MSTTRVSHATRNLDMTVGTAVASSTSMLVGDMAAGTIHVSGVTATHSVAVYGSTDGSEYRALYGFDGQAATVTVPAGGGAVVLPDAFYALRFVKLVSDTDMGTAAAVTISLKS